jgi:hypothetical protein
MKKIRMRAALRTLALATGLAAAGIGLTSTSASALNDFRPGLLQNANLKCVDMTQTQNPDQPAILYDCNKHDWQLFQIVHSFLPGQDTLHIKYSNQCLWSDGVEFDRVLQHPCIDYSQFQSWRLTSTGQIVNVYSGLCLTANGSWNDATVVTRVCNGGSAQHWLGF